ncbi:uncharacterized protein ALTATR162_LOCUS449 [Alternaria atra]|uniref:HD domain-containing protein n=1 Tax=Alternaria atra TaxID=119953 RepID=A0A8J2N1E7_9PLEO|nr:uncharacterized protein ALTATR162_LOCUS449 [Alternaria atra]CAG5138837.1 unnamed protein product [Alternaria atra]
MASMQFFFLELIEALKTTPRRGWVLRGVPDPESVSDHMYRMAIMCLMAPGAHERLRMRAACMALVHDMGEALIGDITPSDGITQKHEREEMALKFLACTLRSSNPDFADLLLELWHEYEDGKTETAILVRQLDKLECIHQAVVYEQRNGRDLGEFMELKEKVTLPGWQQLLNDCLHKHEEIQSRKAKSPVVIFVSGGPGVGKGTQSALLAEEFGFHHISVGDLLREEAARSESPYKDFIPESIERSILLPAQLTTQLLSQAMGDMRGPDRPMFLLDGFPRNVAQVVDFESKICKDYATISLDCSETELLTHLHDRSAYSTRIDDNPDSITKRLKTFNENNTEVLKYLQQRGPLFHIECRGSIDEVYAGVRGAAQEILRIQEV